jgi:hypothetical protein
MDIFKEKMREPNYFESEENLGYSFFVEITLASNLVRL